MEKRTKLKRSIFFSAIITFLAFAYKMGLGILTMSMVLIVGSLSTLMVFICKVAFVKNITKSRESKKKAYLVMFISAFIYSLLFIAFVVLKINGIDTSNQSTYEGIVGSLFILFIIIMFVLSIIGLKGALDKTDIMVIGLKEMTFISALTDLVVITEFVARIILEYKDVPNMDVITGYVPLGIGALMLLTNLVMFIRYLRYKA